MFPWFVSKLKMLISIEISPVFEKITVILDDRQSKLRTRSLRATTRPKGRSRK